MNIQSILVNPQQNLVLLQLDENTHPRGSVKLEDLYFKEVEFFKKQEWTEDEEHSHEQAREEILHAYPGAYFELHDWEDWEIQMESGYELTSKSEMVEEKKNEEDRK